MAPSIKPILKAVCLVTATIILIFWNYVPLFPVVEFPIVILVALLVLVGISLHSFLIYRILAGLHGSSVLPSSSPLTALTGAAIHKLDVFLYETRKGSFTLLVLSVLWVGNLVYFALLAWLDLALRGPVSGVLGRAGKDSVVMMTVCFIFILLTFVVHLAAAVYVVVVGVKALWRIAAPRGTLKGDRAEEEGIMLFGDGDEGDDEWDGWKGA